MRLVTPLTKRREIYSDILKTPYSNRNPVSDDLTKKVNEEAVKESIKNLILTNRGERLMQPDVGSDLRKLLFENYTPATNKIVETLIKNTIKNYEPRAEIIGVSIVGEPDRNSVMVNIVFATKLVEDPISFNVMIERIR